MDQGQPVALNEFAGGGLGFAQGFAVQQHTGTEGLGALHFVEGGMDRHHDGGRNAQPTGVAGDPLGVVARRHRDHPDTRLVRRQVFQLIERATILERAGVLQVLQLQSKVGPEALRQAGGSDRRGQQDLPGESDGGGADVVQGHAHGRLLRSCHLVGLNRPITDREQQEPDRCYVQRHAGAGIDGEE